MIDSLCVKMEISSMIPPSIYHVPSPFQVIVKEGM